jgi:acyl phosphate:glycerol-3-phosphate acyltransferase
MYWLLLPLAYLLGSVSFAILLSRRTGLDLRASGSGNPGATNVLRLAGRKLALLTLCGDICKGLIPALIAKGLGLSLGQQAWIGLAAFLGHLYPIYFQFRGGKGVATAAGVITAICWPASVLAAAIWSITFALSRTSSIASLIAAPMTLPLIAWYAPAALVPMSVLVLLILWRHRRNLKSLIAGSEHHF